VSAATRVLTVAAMVCFYVLSADNFPGFDRAPSSIALPTSRMIFISHFRCRPRSVTAIAARPSPGRGAANPEAAPSPVARPTVVRSQMESPLDSLTRTSFERLLRASPVPKVQQYFGNGRCCRGGDGIHSPIGSIALCSCQSQCTFGFFCRRVKMCLRARMNVCLCV